MELPEHVPRITYYLPSNKRDASPVLQGHILERKVSVEGTVAPVLMDCPVSVLYVIDALIFSAGWSSPHHDAGTRCLPPCGFSIPYDHGVLPFRGTNSEE